MLIIDVKLTEGKNLLHATIDSCLWRIKIILSTGDNAENDGCLFLVSIV